MTRAENKKAARSTKRDFSGVGHMERGYEGGVNIKTRANRMQSNQCKSRISCCFEGEGMDEGRYLRFEDIGAKYEVRAKRVKKKKGGR